MSECHDCVHSIKPVWTILYLINKHSDNDKVKDLSDGGMELLNTIIKKFEKKNGTCTGLDNCHCV